MTLQQTLPEINISNQLDWDDINFLSLPKQKEQHKEEITTTGLTRALSLPRQVNKTKKEVINISTSNPSHLFWVPASQHPEIAPAEFEKYVDSHGLMIRKKSVKRRESILSVYFTANDQKLLDELAKNSSEEENGKRKLVLRRSISLHLPTSGDYIRNVPDLLVFDRNSSPLDESRALVPKGDRPLLRRGARTNFKRNSSVTAPNTPQLVNSLPITRSSSVDSNSSGIILSDTSHIEEQEPLSPVVESIEEVRDLCIATREDSSPPVASIIMSRSVSTSTATTNNSRKSAWSWSSFWSEEKKNNKIDSVTVNEEQEEEELQPKVSKSTDIIQSSSKRFTLSSLFSRKSKQNINNTTSMELLNEAPKDFQLNKMYMTRLPLHVERAIYKLSHVKLANPRRPLHEQVLISNQMFWYLSVIASNQHSQPLQLQQQHQHNKKPRNRLVKKQRQQQKKNVIISGGGTFINTKLSTGFVVPDNYLNPKKKTNELQQELDQNNKQSSDSSSDDDDDDEVVDEPEEELDNIPLALYKNTNTHRLK